MFNLFNFLLKTAIGDPLGGCLVTPGGYSVMLQKVCVYSVLIGLAGSSICFHQNVVSADGVCTRKDCDGIRGRVQA